MSGFPTKDGYRSMIKSFRTINLQALLGAFNQNINGRRSVLKHRALELFRNRPVGFNYQAYLNKIFEIHQSMQNQRQVRMSRAAPPYFLHQPLNLSRAGLSSVSRMPTNQQVNSVPIQRIQYDMHIANPTLRRLVKIKLKSLPLSKMYEILSDVYKPTKLVGYEICSLQNAPIGMREAAFKINMSAEQINYIIVNRDVTKSEYFCQLQIRICILEPTSTDTTNDSMPRALHIRINNQLCNLPPVSHKTSPGTEARRPAIPINCTHLLTLNPSISNTLTFNWIPDEKTYVMAVYLVKNYCPSLLIQNILNKRVRNSEETKEHIINSLANIDADEENTYRFSLVCPIGQIRMDYPAKSINCTHLQCFDLKSFILISEKTSNWLCPVCKILCFYDDLQVQKYFLDVVSSRVPSSCKYIELLENGTWRIGKENEDSIESSVCEEKSIDCVSLDDSDQHSKDVKNEENYFTDMIFVDSSINNEEGPSKYVQKNEVEATDALQPATKVNLKPQAQIQPEQPVASSLQGVVNKID